MAMRRWFARTYHQPPNSPLFDAETMSFWIAQMLADEEVEKRQLHMALRDARNRTDAAATAWRDRVRRRLGELGDTVVPEDDGSLARDIEAANRNELPEFMKRRMRRDAGGSGG